MIFTEGVIAGIQKVAKSGECVDGSERSSDNNHALIARLKKKIRPWDIVNTDPRSLDAFGKVYKPLSVFVQGTRFGHSAMYEGSGNVIEARMGKGVFRRKLKDLVECNKVKVVRPKASADERRDAVKYVRKQIGKDFSLMALATAGAKPTIMSKGHEGSAQRRALDSIFCSNMLANAYHKTPFNPDRSISDTRPVDILKSKRVKPVGEIS